MARAEYHRARRELLKLRGLCIQCGERDPKKPHVRCGQCLAYQRTKMARARGIKQRQRIASALGVGAA